VTESLAAGSDAPGVICMVRKIPSPFIFVVAREA